MRKKLVIGNWKMYGDLQEAKNLFSAVAKGSQPAKEVHVAVAPPAPFLALLAQSDLGLSLAAQDCSAHESFGAYTGEFSASMLQSSGVKYIIVGHSERRMYHGETDELIGRKIQSTIIAGLFPVYCCGELLSDRDSNTHAAVVERQLRKALEHIDFSYNPKFAIAYEPVWAIGTGRTATADQAQEMHRHLRQVLSEIAGSTIAENTPILYGGSVKPGNATELFAQADVDGGLIGGASLVAEDFLAIIQAAKG